MKFGYNLFSHRLMNAAGEGDGGGGSGEGTPDVKTIEQLQKQVEELSSKLNQTEEVKNKINSDYENLKKEFESKKMAKLEEAGDYKTLWENEKKVREQVEQTMREIEEDNKNQKAKILEEAKLEAAYARLGGRDKFYDPEDIRAGKLELIVIDPKTGKWSEAGLKLFEDDFRSRKAHALKSADKVGGAAVKPGAEEDISKLSFQERKKLYLEEHKRKK